MPYQAWSQHRAKPRTYVGQFLRAMILRDGELQEQMRRNLNGGNPGWNDDEPAVVELVCQRILRLLFGKKYTVRDIAEFIDLIELAAAGDPPIDRPKVEMLIREAIGEPGAEAKDIPRSQKFVLRGIMAPAAAFRLELNESLVDEIIVDSERLAFERGWHPPLIRRQGQPQPGQAAGG
jgi:hypothetical protein